MQELESFELEQGLVEPESFEPELEPEPELGLAELLFVEVLEAFEALVERAV